MPHSAEHTQKNQNRIATFLQAAFAVCSTIALAYMLPTTGALYEKTNSAVWIFCALGLFFLIRYAWSTVPSVKGKLYFTACGFLMGAVYALGRYVYLFSEAQNLPGILLLALLLAPALAALLGTLQHFFASMASHGLPQGVARTAFFSQKHLFITVFCIMLLCYVPCFLAYFPANINYDIHNQTQQALTCQFSANHPLLHTLLIKACLDVGNAVLGSYTNGFALYAAVQTLLLVGCFAYCVCCIVRLTPKQTWLHVAALLFFALYPVNHLFAVTTTKDVLASGMLLVSLCSFSPLAFEMPTEKRPRIRLIALFAVSSMLAMLLRNGTVYAYIVFALCTLFSARKLRMRLFLPAALSIGLFFGASASLKAACHASDASPVEMLSIPMQQLVRANIYYPERFTAEEQALYKQLIESNDRYEPQISDPIKEFVDRDFVMENRTALFKLYCSIGKKAPDAYLNAFLLVNLGAWYPDEITHANVHGNDQGYLHTSDWYFGWNRAAYQVEKHSYLPAVEKFYNRIAQQNQHQRLPVVSMLFSPGFACQCLFVLAMLLLYKKQWRYLLLFTPLIAYWLGLLLTPCIYIRYVYPIIVCLPLLAALVTRSNASPAEVRQP